MPSQNKSGSEAVSGQEELPFDQALKKLEAVVEAMEGGELPLEQLLQRFEEGARLVRVCQAKLEEAELKIQKLEKNLGGEITLKPWKITNDQSES